MSAEYVIEVVDTTALPIDTIVLEESGDTIIELVEETVEVSLGEAGPPGPAGANGTFPIFSATGKVYVRSGTHRLYLEQAGTITKARASVGAPPVGSPIEVIVRCNGNVVTQLSVPSGGYTTVQNDLTYAVSPGDWLSVDITMAGSVEQGEDLTVTVTVG